MGESLTITSRLCLEQIKQELSEDLVLDPYSLQDENPAPQNENMLQLHPYLVKEEIKEEFVEEEIKVEEIEIKEEFVKEEIKEEFVEVEIKGEFEIVDDSLVSFNTDMHFDTEQSIPLNVMFCDHCYYITNDENNLTEHMSTHIVAETSINEEQNQIVSSKLKEELVENLNEQLSEPTKMSCDKCEYRTQYKCFLMTHKVGHNEANSKDRPFKCAVCGFGCKRSFNLKRHQIVHSRFHCETCFFKTKSKRRFKYHKRDKCKGNPKKHYDRCDLIFCCDKCIYKTDNKSNYINHIIKNFVGRPFKCNLCDFTNEYSRMFRVHLHQHY